MPKLPLSFIKPAKNLKDSLRFTHLDVENPGFVSGSISGFGFLNKDLKTQYPPTTTGKPTPTQYPSGPAKRFISNFGPRNVYLDNINKENSPLEQSLESSRLDDFKNPNPDPTIYPLTSKGVSSTGGYFPIKGVGAKQFNQRYNFDNTYLNYISPTTSPFPINSTPTGTVNLTTSAEDEFGLKQIKRDKQKV
jgi:hypothetical protein